MAKIGPPKLTDTFLEASRAKSEYAELLKKWDALKKEAPQGDGSPVMILPGFSNDDRSSAPMIRFLRELGYEVYGWENGVNLGLNAQTAEFLKGRLEELYKKHGKKVKLIGHSLGGIFARELAREFPDMVEQVITMGSPFGAGPHPNSAVFGVRYIIRLLDKDGIVMNGEELHDRSLTPPPVPTTSIYTKTDGVVNWKTCINPDTKKSENVRVLGSHCGLIMNYSTLLIVADRLAQKPAKWKPFEKKDYSKEMVEAIGRHKGFTPSKPDNDNFDGGPRLF